MNTTPPQTDPELHTLRLCLRVLRVDEAHLLRDYVLRNREHLDRWEGLRSDSYYTLEDCRSRIAQQRATLEQGSGYALALLTPAQDCMLGTVGLSNIVRGLFQACHLGYALDHAAQGQGLMHEALTRVIAFAFEELCLHRLMANYMPHNQRSEKVLQRLGFEREGYARDYLKIGGRWQDHVLTALINPAPM